MKTMFKKGILNIITAVLFLITAAAAPAGAGSMSDYLENKILEHVVGKTSFTMPSSVYLALVTTLPTDSSTGSTLVEPAGGSYARKSVAGADWGSASGGSISNTNTITFASATASWGTIVGWALVDASTNGNVLMWGSLGTSKIVGNGDTASYAAGQLTLTQD